MDHSTDPDRRNITDQRYPDSKLTTMEATTLYDLRRRWSDAYVIELRDGVWSAYRINDALFYFTADSAEELRGDIREDYANWQRDIRKGQA